LIHEFKQMLWVSTELGDGIVICLIDYGPQANSVFMVGLENGEIKFFDTNQVRMCSNHTFGISVQKD
jgi:hypothetical protein